MPAISKRMRPGLTTATQWSGAPLPEPIRVSAGFLVAGLSGKIRIQILPPRLTERVIARRAASIWRLVIQAGSRGSKTVFAESQGRAALGLAGHTTSLDLAMLDSSGHQHGYTPCPMTAEAATGSRRGFSPGTSPR